MSASTSASNASRPGIRAADSTKRSPDVGLALTLWKRDMLHLWREKSRWFGVVAQPLLFWLIIAAGLDDVFAARAGADAFGFMFPGMIVMVVLFTTIFATMSVIEDRNAGFLQQVLVAPGSRLALVVGKTLGVVTMALIQVALILAVAPLAGIDLLALNWPALIGALVLGAVGLTALSFVFAWLIPSTHGYHAIMAALLLPLWLLSGALFPAAGGTLGVFMAANPMTWFVDGLRSAFAGEAGLTYVHSPPAAFALLGGFALLMLVLACYVSRRRKGPGA